MPTRTTVITIDRLAVRQHGLVSWAQLAASGLSESGIRHLRERGWLIRVAPNVYRVSGSPASWRQQVMAACLETTGVASHRTAAVLHGLDGFRPGVIDVVSPRWRRQPRDGVRVHESMDLVAADLSSVDGIPCTSLVRTLVDLPAVSSAHRAGQALDHACRTDDTVLASVRQRFLEVARRGRRGTTRMRAMLNERAPGQLTPGSNFEAMTLRLLRQGGIQEPVRQFEVRFDDGTKAYLDMAWPAQLVYLECDSLAYNFGKHAHQHDRTRRRKLVLLGWRPLEFTYEDVRDRPRLVLRQVDDALTSGH